MGIRITLSPFLVLLLAVNSSFATEPFPWTFVIKSNGAWSLWSDYLNGGGIVIEDEDSNTKKTLRIDEAIPADEMEHYETTAGPLWGEYALWYLLKLGDTEVLRVRTRYGTDVLVDLDAGSFLRAEDRRMDLRQSDSAQILSTLKDAKHILFSPKSSIRDIRRVQSAIVHAIHLELKDTVDVLRDLERASHVGSGVLPSSSDPFTKQEPIDQKDKYWHYSTYDTRRLTSLALRRFGQKPTGYPSVGFLPQDEERIVNVAERKDRIAVMRAGVTPTKIYENLGPPDYVQFGSWRYDVDDAKPFTALLKWDDAGRLEKIEYVAPPLWATDLQGSIGP